jgi:hypothetical protein
MFTSRDPFGEALAALPGFINEMEPDFMGCVDWVLDQCGWCYISNAEWNILEERYDYYTKRVTV